MKSWWFATGKSNTPTDPDAGWWAWYCPEHFAATAPWPSSLRAPTHLIPADLEARIAADRQAAARAEADESAKAEECVALARKVLAGRWTTFGDIGKVVFGNNRSGVAVGSALASLPISERFNSRVRMADGTCAASGRDLAQADEAELLAKWNTMAREDGLPVDGQESRSRRTGCRLRSSPHWPRPWSSSPPAALVADRPLARHRV